MMRQTSKNKRRRLCWWHQTTQGKETMKTIGLARLGRDAEVKYTQGGDAVCSLSLAVSYGKKGEDGNRPTQWIDAALWGKQAEALAPYLLKGTVHCFTLSDLRLETYQAKDGTTGTKIAARVDNVELGPRVEQPQQGQRQAPAQNGYQQARQTPAQQRQPAQQQDWDDDIAF